MSVGLTVQLNGTETELRDGARATDAAAHVGVSPDESGVALAIDGAVIPRGEWLDTTIEPGARIEVLRAAAGG